MSTQDNTGSNQHLNIMKKSPVVPSTQKYISTE